MKAPSLGLSKREKDKTLSCAFGGVVVKNKLSDTLISKTLRL